MTRVAIVCAAYIAAQILSDITSVRIILVAGLSMDAGTLVYPITFTLRDVVHKVAGLSTARALIITAALINVAMAGLFWLVSVLPPDTRMGAQAEFGMVLSPVWRIVFASIVAEVVSEWVDGDVYQVWVNRMGGRHQWMRVVASNGVSVPLDSAIFVTLAFAGTMPTELLIAIFFSNIIIKGLVTVLSIPLIYVSPHSTSHA